MKEEKDVMVDVGREEPKDLFKVRKIKFKFSKTLSTGRLMSAS